MSESSANSKKKSRTKRMTVPTIQKKKSKGSRITMLTAYDYTICLLYTSPSPRDRG